MRVSKGRVSSITEYHNQSAEYVMVLRELMDQRMQMLSHIFRY